MIHNMMQKFVVLIKYYSKMELIKYFIFFAINIYFVSVSCVEAPSIFIPGNGVIHGIYMKMFRTQNIKAYLGIRYADASRFSPPNVDVPSWSGVFNATSYGPDCWQQPIKTWNKQTETVLGLLSVKKHLKDSEQNYDENCLYLNIYVPDGPPGSNGYAVIVWIHSGDFSYGNANDMEPFQLVFKQKVIVVTFSYRLNFFGFFSTDDGEAQGNFGLMDQSAALYWTKKNINFFGGDDKRITLMGHSAGAVSVGLHLTSGEWSKGAFHKAIIMSGNPLMQNSIRTQKDHDIVLDMISNTFGCVRRPSSMLIHCLKRIDAKIISQNLPIVNWGPIIDFGLSNASYPFIENHPSVLLQNGNFHKVPVIIGITDMEDVLTIFSDDLDEDVTSDDFKNYLNDIAVNDIRQLAGERELCTNYEIASEALQYVYSETGNVSIDQRAINKKIISVHNEKTYLASLYSMANMLSKYENVFLYMFNVRPNTKFCNLPSWVTVPKLFDQIFVWGIPYMSKSDIVSEWNSTDKKISDVVMTLWANFAKSSNPTKSNVYVKWTAVKEANLLYLAINENFQMDILSYNYRLAFWNDYYPKVLQFSIDCCNATNSASNNYNKKVDYKHIFCNFENVNVYHIFLFYHFIKFIN